MQICICVYMYMCIYVYMYICTHVYMYICTYVYVRSPAGPERKREGPHTHIDTQKRTHIHHTHTRQQGIHVDMYKCIFGYMRSPTSTEGTRQGLYTHRHTKTELTDSHTHKRQEGIHLRSPTSTKSRRQGYCMHTIVCLGAGTACATSSSPHQHTPTALQHASEGSSAILHCNVVRGVPLCHSADELCQKCWVRDVGLRYRLQRSR